MHPFFCVLFGAFTAVLTAALWKYTPASWILEAAAPPRLQRLCPPSRKKARQLALLLFFFCTALMPLPKTVGAAFRPLLLACFLLQFLFDGLCYTLPDQWTAVIALLGALNCLLQSQSLACGIMTLSARLLAAEEILCLWLVSALLCTLFRKPLPMGMGDAKLVAAAAFVLGGRLLSALLAASLLAGLWCALLLAAGRIEKRDRIPFGPFLVIGFLLYL